MGDKEKTSSSSGVSSGEFQSGVEEMKKSGGPTPPVMPCKQCWIGFEVVDEDGNPIAQVFNLNLQQISKAEGESATSDQGKLKLQPVENLAYNLISITGEGVFRLVSVGDAPAGKPSAAGTGA